VFFKVFAAIRNVMPMPSNQLGAYIIFSYYKESFGWKISDVTSRKSAYTIERLIYSIVGESEELFAA
jgi:hypothetical protein